MKVLVLLSSVLLTTSVYAGGGFANVPEYIAFGEAQGADAIAEKAAIADCEKVRSAKLTDLAVMGFTILDKGKCTPDGYHGMKDNEYTTARGAIAFIK